MSADRDHRRMSAGVAVSIEAPPSEELESVTRWLVEHPAMKPVSPSVSKLMESVMQPDPDVSELVHVLDSDPALASAVLRSVNSATFHLQSPCTSVRRAVPLLGTRGTLQIVTASSIVNAFCDDSPISMQIVEHAKVTAALCSYFGSLFHLPKEDCYTLGLLHDVGKLMLHQAKPEEYARVWDSSKDMPDVAHAVEVGAFGFDHAQVAAPILRSWRIPEPLPSLIEWHHRRDVSYATGGKFAIYTYALNIADRLAYHLLYEAECPPNEALGIDDAPFELGHGVHRNQLEASWKRLRMMAARAVADSPTVDEDVDDLSPATQGPLSAAATNVVAESERAAALEGETVEAWPCVRCERALMGPPGEGEAGLCRVCMEALDAASRQSLPRHAILASACGVGVMAMTGVGHPGRLHALLGFALAAFLFVALRRGYRRVWLEMASEEADGADPKAVP